MLTIRSPPLQGAMPLVQFAPGGGVARQTNAASFLFGPGLSPLCPLAVGTDRKRSDPLLTTTISYANNGIAL